MTTEQPIRVAIVGASGRLGRVIGRVVDADGGFALHAALTSQSRPSEIDGADVVVDATCLEVSRTVVAEAARRDIPIVVATSGWTARDIEAIPSAQRVIFVPNFSLGSVVATALARVAGRFFASVEIIEAHHAQKLDAPSGTARRTAELLAADRERRACSPDSPARGAIIDGVPVHALRLPGITASQRVVFGGEGETLAIQHDTQSDASYEAGIALAIRHAATMEHKTVGLDGLLGLDRVLTAASEIGGR